MFTIAGGFILGAIGLALLPILLMLGLYLIGITLYIGAICGYIYCLFHYPIQTIIITILYLYFYDKESVKKVEEVKK